MWYGASGLKYGAPGAFDLGFEVFGSCIVEEDGYIYGAMTGRSRKMLLQQVTATRGRLGAFPITSLAFLILSTHNPQPLCD